MTADYNFWECPAASKQAFVATVHAEGFNGLHYNIGIAEWGLGGYKPTKSWFPTLKEAEEEAKLRNNALGLTELDALSIKTSSMRAPGGRVRRS